MKTTFRILDIDAQRAQRTERYLLPSMRAHNIKGQVYQICEPHELSRMGLTKLPALEFNGIILFQGTELNKELLDDVCFRLSRARKKQEMKI